MEKDIIVKQVFQTESISMCGIFPHAEHHNFFVSLIYVLHTGSGSYKNLVGMNQDRNNFFLVVLLVNRRFHV